MVAAAALSERAEELASREITVLVEVFESIRSAESILAFDEFLVGLVLELLVPVEEVVGTSDVLGVVLAVAAASDGVADLQLRTFVV